MGTRIFAFALAENAKALNHRAQSSSGSMAQTEIFFFELPYVVAPNPGISEGGA
jgi:hypothetical protein